MLTKIISTLTISCLLTASLLANAYADVAISTTIRPLYFIALAVTGDKGEVTALIDSKSSPHHFNLTPSDRIEISRTDMVVWVGPDLESHLSSGLQKMIKEESIITAMDLPGLILHKLGSGHQNDAHIWLDTRNASLIATEIAKFAKQLDPDNGEYYQSNLSRFQASLNRLAEQIEQRFSSEVAESFAVYHNGFQYFEKQFGLSHQLELVVDPEVAPTIAQVINTRAKLKQLKPKCLITEPESNTELIRTMLSEYKVGNSIEQVSVDLLGNSIAASDHAYTDLMEHVADQFSRCLGFGDLGD